ncbi:MAG: hypothetical protein NTW86_06485 [Candidatus Sumerlaeota bacterium]|nr:hypothetical protein [Candidatus Sumerlaeota bacterium]
MPDNETPLQHEAPQSASASAAKPPIESHGPAQLPSGFWRQVDYLLHHPEEVMESLKQDVGLWELARTFFLIALVMAALYGAVMGATNLLQGSVMPMQHRILMILVTAVKVPVLFLLTLLIVLPPIYVSNTFMGARLPFRAVVAMTLGAMASTSISLASMGSVAFFFALTSKTYDFIKLLHVLFFLYAGLVGLSALAQCAQVASIGRRRATPQLLFLIWLLLYGFVGTQLAWVLRPFVGSPNEKFQVFRPRSGSFYESVGQSLDNLMKH